VDSPAKRDSAEARKKPKNAVRTPSRVHALLGALYERQPFCSIKSNKLILKNFTQNKDFSNNRKVTIYRNGLEADSRSPSDRQWSAKKLQNVELTFFQFHLY
jgi:hypothetical protein